MRTDVGHRDAIQTATSRGATALRLAALATALTYAGPAAGSRLPSPAESLFDQAASVPPAGPHSEGQRPLQGALLPYVLDDGHVLQEANGAVAEHPGYRRYHYGYGPLSVVDTLGKRFIQTDALGSPTDLTSTSGAIASMRKYDAWGSYRDATAPGSTDEKLGYTGHQWDPETGLVYARARYFDPELGRFISRDTFEGTLFEAPSLHRYAYAWANPLRYRDLDGHQVAAPVEEPPESEQEPVDLNEVVRARKEAATAADANERAEERSKIDARLKEREECIRRGACQPDSYEVAEAEDAPSTAPALPDDPASEIRAHKGAINARIREVGETGQTVVEAGMSAIPVAGTLYALKMTVEDLQQGNYAKAAAEAGIAYGPGVAVVFFKYGSRVVAKVISADVAQSEKLLSNENVLKVLRYGEEGAEAAEKAAIGGSGPKLLSTGKRVPNAAGQIVSFVTQEERTFYRVFSGDSTVGRFLTSVKPRSSAFAEDALALPPGNRAAFVQEVVVPAGTRLQRSRASPAFGRRGGAEQFELLGRIPDENFGPGVPLP
jgi:RHS repeat-associated protein